MFILWSKRERAIAPGCIKVTLVRRTVLGTRKTRQFLERPLPSPLDQRVGTVMCLTRCRRGWRFRLWTPLISTYFVVTPERTWRVIGMAYR